MDEKICPILNSNRQRLDVEPMVKCQREDCAVWIVETEGKIVDIPGSSMGDTQKIKEIVYKGCGLIRRR